MSELSLQEEWLYDEGINAKLSAVTERYHFFSFISRFGFWNVGSKEKLYPISELSRLKNFHEFQEFT